MEKNIVCNNLKTMTDIVSVNTDPLNQLEGEPSMVLTLGGRYIVNGTHKYFWLLEEKLRPANFQEYVDNYSDRFGGNGCPIYLEHLYKAETFEEYAKAQMFYYVEKGYVYKSKQHFELTLQASSYTTIYIAQDDELVYPAQLVKTFTSQIVSQKLINDGHTVLEPKSKLDSVSSNNLGQGIRAIILKLEQLSSRFGANEVRLHPDYAQLQGALDRIRSGL